MFLYFPRVFSDAKTENLKNRPIYCFFFHLSHAFSERIILRFLTNGHFKQIGFPSISKFECSK